MLRWLWNHSSLYTEFAHSPLTLIAPGQFDREQIKEVQTIDSHLASFLENDKNLLLDYKGREDMSKHLKELYRENKLVPGMSEKEIQKAMADALQLACGESKEIEVENIAIEGTDRIILRLDLDDERNVILEFKNSFDITEYKDQWTKYAISILQAHPNTPHFIFILLWLHYNRKPESV